MDDHSLAATPHQAGALLVRTNPKNRMNDSTDLRGKRRSTSNPKRASQRQSLAWAVEI
jgi:hypothetical protein